MAGAPRRIAVLGNGGFGTALACTLGRGGHDVSLWGHDPDYTGKIAATRENDRYLPGIAIDPGIRIGSRAEELCAGADLVLSVVPAQHVRAVWTDLGAAIAPAVPVVSCSKGMEEATGRLPTRILGDLRPEAPLFVLTGPCHAEELARGMPATVVLAGSDPGRLTELQAVLAGPTLRIYRNLDPLGAELAAAVKNIIAIAAGISDGLGLGDNAKAALLTRGVAEIARFGVALGAQRETFYGLAGIGDLITTAVSPHGRNRALGERIGRGATLPEVLAATHQVAEGVWTCRAVLEAAAGHGVAMPITAEVARILFDGKAPAEAVADLMTRLLGEEG